MRITDDESRLTRTSTTEMEERDKYLDLHIYETIVLVLEPLLKRVSCRFFFFKKKSTKHQHFLFFLVFPHFHVSTSASSLLLSSRGILAFSYIRSTAQ